jgi:hypothetical protein
MYGHCVQDGHRFVWILDNESAPATELDSELWRRYVELRGDIEITLQGLGMMRNWLDAKLREIDYEKDDVVTIFGWEMMNALAHVEVTSSQIRELPGKHLVK